MEDESGSEGIKLPEIPVDIKGGEWALKAVPWIGGRVISMEHLPSGKTNEPRHTCAAKIAKKN